MGVLDNIAALKAGYDVGQSVFGQDDASKDRALKDRALGLETAMRVKQMEDNQAYQQGQLANDWERNRITEEQYKRGYGLGNRELDAKINIADMNNRTQLRDQDIRQSLGLGNIDVARQGQEYQRQHWNMQNALQQKELQLNEMVAQNRITAQQAQLELDRARNEYMGGYYKNLGADAEMRRRVTEGELADRENILNVRSALNDMAFNGKTLWDLPENLRNQIRPFMGYAANPDHEKNRDVVMSIKPNAALNDEQFATVSSVVQPYLNEGLGVPDNAGAKTAAIRFKGLEPGSQPGKFKVRIAVDKELPDGSKVTLGEGTDKNAEPMYVTQGRQAIADGGQPLEVDVGEITKLVTGMGNLGALRATHPEYMENLRLAAEDHVGASSSADVTKARLARAKAAKDDAKVQELTEKELSQRRSSLETNLSKMLDERAGFNLRLMQEIQSGEVDPAELSKRGIDVNAIQRYQQAKAQFIDKIRRGAINGSDLDMLRQMTPGGLLDTIMGDDTMRQSLDQVFNAARPPQAAPTPAAPKTSGSFVNPRSQGGGQRPFPGRAGGFQPSSYQHAAAVGGVLQAHLIGGKSQEHIAHLRGPFAERLAAMLEDAPGDVKIYSGYRSPQRQAQIFAGSDKSGHRVAHPGHSNHNHGLAADLKYASPKVKKWVHDNAARYGLAFRMPWEPWHIEPAGAGPDARNWGI